MKTLIDSYVGHNFKNSYYNDGSKKFEYFNVSAPYKIICLDIKNQFHNDEGPAIIESNNNKQYFLYGKRLDFIFSDEELAKYIRLSVFH